MNIQPAYLRIGEIARVNIINANENRQARGKERPGLLVAEDRGHWWVLGFTTQHFFKSGEMAGRPRPEIRTPERYGLRRPSYMWSFRLARVSKIDISDHFGFADGDLIEDAIAFAGLYGAWARGLRAAVELDGAA